MSQQHFDRAQLITFLEGHETGGSPGHLHPGCPSNTMDIILRTIRQIVIHHMADIGHVNPAGCNIRRDENSDLSSPKSVEGTKALGETSVPVDDRDAMAGLFKRLTKSINSTLCPGKYKDGPSFHSQQRHQQLRLLLRGRMMQRLDHTISRRRGRCHHHTNCTIQARLNQVGHIRLNRGGKE
jgi:hypothetical protein